MPLGRLLPDSPGRHRVCGRECSDGSACQNTVDRPGDVCHVDSHRREDPRVDDGPTDPSEVPLSGEGSTAVSAGFTVGKVLAAGGAVALGFGAFSSLTAFYILPFASAIAFGVALDAYQRRALADDDSDVE